MWNIYRQTTEKRLFPIALKKLFGLHFIHTLGVCLIIAIGCDGMHFDWLSFVNGRNEMNTPKYTHTDEPIQYTIFFL